MDFSDKFYAKNAASARAWAETEDRKKPEHREARKPAEPKKGICEKCKKEALVRPHRSREADMKDGAASYGVVVHYYCEDCYPKSRRDTPTEPPLSSKQLKSLLRGAKKNLR